MGPRPAYHEYMPRKSEYGKFIFSAGEIGEYVVCPEAWRLKMVQGIRSSVRENAKLGTELHQEWAEICDEAVFLTRGVKMAATLVIAAVVIYLLTNI